jgi:hypothetical protein
MNNQQMSNEERTIRTLDLLFGVPGASDQILADEAAGQKDFVGSDTLPIDMRNATREQLMAVGFEFGEPTDNLFIACKLPDGWTKKATSHSMHSTLHDDKGRERAGIFYKAAFYDRSAHISFRRRYNWNQQPVGGYDQEDYREKPDEAIVTDGNTIIWRSEPVNLDAIEDLTERYRAQNKQRDKAKTWLGENFPEWESPFAYWD